MFACCERELLFPRIGGCEHLLPSEFSTHTHTYALTNYLSLSPSLPLPERARAFKQTNKKTVSVPCDFEGGLGKWLTNQRQKRKHGDLRRDREEKLKRIGIEWKFRCVLPWKDRFENLKAFKRKYGVSFLSPYYTVQLQCLFSHFSSFFRVSF